ncbi:flagellar hook protein FlgE [Geoalkalibacter ferrihydriticus]|uniref:Flagellar hook protein FlgE n=2 Tax=Geoalkalibacter ferrihydriticus TaxID=392333 RepID=A0A0C2HXS9_9BACT|nr:flagellar basal-body rod protein FlgF [Geoalkalibacter ferrihydriticus]KIH77562.1 flagellar hook-basal body protein [Geoalkalibacter ferrihydriticus DSM 17813]SDL68225.1 flagellar hook protein FlgE [Geoalkalibacter ferrihydriticus]
MGISSALYTGVSGLNTNGNAMSVLGNNIANTNTIGFKSSRTIFSDLLSANISGSGGASQVGRGTQLSVVDNIFSQGTFENTESNTDLAIEGDGFFIVKAPGGQQDFYTRAGAFRFNEQGFLVNPEGFRVQGKAFEADGTLGIGDPAEIRVDTGTLIPARPTSEINLTTNLDSNAPVVAGGFDPLNPMGTSSYATSIPVYDTLGNTHLLSTYFTKTDANEWQWNTVVDGAEIGGTPGDLTVVGTGTLEFDTGGNLTSGQSGSLIPGVLTWVNGASTQDIDLSFNTTQYSSDSIVISQGQNGFGAGSLVRIAIDGDGIVTANYSNGERIRVAQIALAKFPNTNGLTKEGSNLYASSANSGDPRVGVPGAELGKIFTNALEQSNVDLAQEFVKMITTQRGFQANSRIITTTDEMLGELINLKR